MPIEANSTTLKVSPSALNPTYNETIFVLESPNIVQNNFKWVVEIWIDGLPNATGTTKVTTLVILPNPEGFGVIDVQRHIENYISSTFYPADLDTTSVAPESFRNWSLDITEVFENYVWNFNRNNTDGGNVAFINTSEDNYFDIGDDVTILQDPTPVYPEYDGDWTVTNVNIDRDSITINKAYAGTVENDSGTATGNKIVEVHQVDASNLEYRSFNGVINFADFNTFDYTVYNMETANPTAKFLTNVPDNYELRRNDPLWINGYSDSQTYNVMRVTTDNGVYIILPISPVPAFKDTFIIQAKIGYNDLLNTTSGVFLDSGALPMVDGNTTFISVEARSGGTSISETKTVKIVDKCSKYENIKLFFLDRLGSYIPLNFDRVSKTNVTNERSNYKQNYGNYDSVADSWGYTSYARGTTTYDISSKKSITCTSDWLTDEQVQLVQILLNSPEVYYIDEAGVYRAITITTNSYEEKKRVSDKLLNYTITFEYSNNDGNQRG
tara:strand:+ start:310 stop:1800 length:1491 start_codon:yes stop_codon:yes gene_type:complete